MISVGDAADWASIAALVISGFNAFQITSVKKRIVMNLTLEPLLGRLREGSTLMNGYLLLFEASADAFDEAAAICEANVRAVQRRLGIRHGWFCRDLLKSLRVYRNRRSYDAARGCLQPFTEGHPRGSEPSRGEKDYGIMSVSKEDLVDAILKLNDLTRRKAIVWSSSEREGNAPNQLSYTVPYEGRTLRITEYDNRRARILHDHPSSPHTPARYKLEIVDIEGNSLYEFPNVQGISDLFASVRTQQSDVDVEGLIRSLIAAQ